MHFSIKRFRSAVTLLKRHNILILWGITGIILTILLLSDQSSGNNIQKEAHRIEKRIIKRQKMLESYMHKVIDTPVDEWAKLNNFPDDMVIYKYNSDTIQFWKNQFPISNDDVDILPLWYRLSELNTKNYYNNQLAYLDESSRYVNLGTGWYLINIYKKDRVKIISGLLIKTEYLNSNSTLISRINPHISKNENLRINHINSTEGVVVHGVDDTPVFSISEEKPGYKSSYNYQLGWIVIMVSLITLYISFYNRRKFIYYLLFLAGLICLRLLCFKYDDYIMGNIIFSPILYADEGIFSSLGNLLLNNLFVFLAVLGLYLLRREIKNFANRNRDINGNRGINGKIALLVCVVPLVLFLYIHFTLKSLINNSTIVLELYKLDELSIYSLLTYFSYGLLFIVLLLSLQLVVSVVNRLGGKSLLSYKATIIYILIISLYTLSLVYSYGLQKEGNRAKIWTNKLSIERDISLELQLKSMDEKIQSDKVIGDILGLIESSNINLLEKRLDEYYLKGISQRYEVNVKICRPNDALQYNQGQYILDCNYYFNRLLRNGVSLGENSSFYFLNNYDGKTSYLGVFYYMTQYGIVNMYIEISSRYAKDMQGYPAAIFDYKMGDNINIPYSYSYGKYIDGRLVSFRGNYNFPISIDESLYDDGFSSFSKGNYLFFVNKISNGRVIIITRPIRMFLSYLVTFSYLVLFYGALIFVFLRVRRMSKNAFRIKPLRNSFRRKITYLVIVSLVIALICMGAGSIWFSINFYNENNKLQMEEKLQTVQNTLSEYCKYIRNYNELNFQDLYSAIDNLASSIQTDINLYDPHGRLIRSTQPELFDKFLLSSRMNAEAYYKLIHEKKRQLQNQEHIADLQYISLYSPIFNSQGDLIAISNIPYFSKTSDFRGDLSSIIATIINIYLILLIATVLVGSILSNQLSKPLAVISNKMKQMDVSKKTEHIDYKSKDEFGLLVGAYNKMVDDLEESTQQLARTEREHVWSEMARQIAHEIKNPLTPMRLSIQHLIRMKQRNIPGWEDKFEDVANSILEQIEILSNTASEFSSFAKFYYEDSVVFNLYSLLIEQKILFDTHDNIRILFCNSTENAMVYARRGQIVRVVVNLLSNAIQAVEMNNGGYIRISLLERDDRYYVSFEDNGPGVKPEDEVKLFKPNFTTKSSGTGLGLAISQNIIEQSGGKITYSKSEFGGANFMFYLPAHNDA